MLGMPYFPQSHFSSAIAAFHRIVPAYLFIPCSIVIFGDDLIRTFDQFAHLFHAVANNFSPLLKALCAL